MDKTGIKKYVKWIYSLFNLWWIPILIGLVSVSTITSKNLFMIFLTSVAILVVASINNGWRIVKEFFVLIVSAVLSYFNEWWNRRP